MTSARICIVRHGETAWNAERRIQGQLDLALNAAGLAQAEAVACALADENFATVISSDLLRARQTAVSFALTAGLPVTLHTGLRERHYGVFQGHTYEEARLRYPEDYRVFSSRDADFDFGSGESLMAFAGRVRACMEEIAAAGMGKTILVITHGGVLDIVYRMATGMPLVAPRDFPIPNAALNWVERNARGWHLLGWADEHHLRATLDELPG